MCHHPTELYLPDRNGGFPSRGALRKFAVRATSHKHGGYSHEAAEVANLLDRTDRSRISTSAAPRGTAAFSCEGHEGPR